MVLNSEPEEIEKLLAFIHTNFADPGRFRVVDSEAPEAALLGVLQAADIDAMSLANVLGEVPAATLQRALASSDVGVNVAEAAVVSRRRAKVGRLRDLAEDATNTERDMYRELKGEWWVFGSQYVAEIERRHIVPLDAYDIALLDGSGALHVVELKGPRVPNLVREHRSHWIPGAEVHEAVAQAMNYLRGLDELGSALETMFRNDLKLELDLRRTFATVVLGHSNHVVGVADRRDIDQAMRTYNSHLARIRVTTYEDLLEAADRALSFD